MPSKRKTSASKTNETAPLTSAEAAQLFASWKTLPALVLAVSGGPDSVALMWLAARWRARLAKGPQIVAVTVDHGLREASAKEARDVKKLARSLGLEHRTLRWTGEKPERGIPAAAREMRYRLLAQASKAHKALHIVTAHTSDDQAETMMMRMARGSGLAGLAAMSREMRRGDGITIVRPFLDVPKARLVATLQRAEVAFADDPTNRDASFTRPRWRALMPALAEEGLDARGLGRLAMRLGRANAAIETIADITERSAARLAGSTGVTEIDPRSFATLPEEIRLRLLARAIRRAAREGEAGLAQLEALCARIGQAFEGNKRPAGRRFKETLAGAAIMLSADLLVVAPAPPRRKRPPVRS